jgi:hypothetical protein
MVEWSKDHVVVICPYNSNSGLIGGILVKLETGHDLQVERGDHQLGWSSGMWKVGIFKAVAPARVD